MEPSEKGLPQVRHVERNNDEQNPDLCGKATGNERRGWACFQETLCARASLESIRRRQWPELVLNAKCWHQSKTRTVHQSIDLSSATPQTCCNTHGSNSGLGRSAAHPGTRKPAAAPRSSRPTQGVAGAQSSGKAGDVVGSCFWGKCPLQPQGIKLIPPSVRPSPLFILNKLGKAHLPNLSLCLLRPVLWTPCSAVFHTVQAGCPLVTEVAAPPQIRQPVGV